MLAAAAEFGSFARLVCNSGNASGLKREAADRAHNKGPDLSSTGGKCLQVRSGFGSLRNALTLNVFALGILPDMLIQHREVDPEFSRVGRVQP